MSVTCQMIMEALEEQAPRSLAESWDNVGLITGHPRQPVDRVLVVLDVTLPVARYAADNGYQLIVSHHPPIFKGITSLRTDSPQGKLLAELVKHSIAVYACHTNLDAAQGGVSDALADILGLEATRPLISSQAEKLLKLVVFVPHDHAETLRQAICAAGAGVLGRYSHCTFQTRGTGTFLPLAGANPYLGTEGRMEYAEEARLETILPQSSLGAVLDAMNAHHPYEEVAYDLIPLANTDSRRGLGRVGCLPEQVSAAHFIDKVKSSLAVAGLRVAGPTDKTVLTVALCGGSGAGLITQAAKAGADVYVTGDVKYHEAQEAADLGLTVIDAGHYATEQPAVGAVARYLRERARQTGWQLTVREDPVRRDVFTFW